MNNDIRFPLFNPGHTVHKFRPEQLLKYDYFYTIYYEYFLSVCESQRSNFQYLIFLAFHIPQWFLFSGII